MRSNLRSFYVLPNKLTRETTKRPQNKESPSVHKKIQYHLELYVICTNMLNRCSNASYHTYAQQENNGNRQIYERVCSFVRDVDSH